MKAYNGEKYIVSFTSFGKRFENACKMIFSLKKQLYTDFHIVLTVFEGDLQDIPPTLWRFIRCNLIELIVAKENLCPHLKYYYTMCKYGDKPIITVDDDRIYSNNTIGLLVNKYESINYKSVVANCAPVMTRTGNVIDPDNVWCVGEQRLTPNAVSYIAMAEGFAGVLYPPNCFSSLLESIPEIKTILYHDDLYLRVLETREHIPVTQVNGVYEIDCIGVQQTDTFNNGLKDNHSLGDMYRNNMTAKFNNDLLRGFTL